MKEGLKAVGLMSGGLDSILAAKIIKDLGVEVHAIYFDQPWGCGSKRKAQAMAEKIGIKLIVMPLGENYLKLIQNPRYGYGTSLNPCIDCHIYMCHKAKKYLATIDGHFVFTGEVLGQRPMSQHKKSLELVEKRSGLEGRLLRPLSARLLEPTISEQEGILDRKQLLSISGRSRKEQIRLAAQYGINDFTQPAGGCLLTEGPFGKRLKDLFQYGYRDMQDIVLLKVGRHFRIDPDYKVIIGRNEKEGDFLMEKAHPQDALLEPSDKPGPTAILQGKDPSDDIKKIAAFFVWKFSKYRREPSLDVDFWLKGKGKEKEIIKPAKIEDDQLEEMGI